MDLRQNDLRAFQKWHRKIEVWRIQIQTYLPPNHPNEAAGMLYVSLRGEAEEEMEWCDIQKVNDEKGIEHVVETLRHPFMTKTIYLKRK